MGKKSLNKIQIIAKIGYILSNIIKIFSIIGIIGCFLGILIVSLGIVGEIELNNITIKGLISLNEKISTGTMISTMTYGLISCIGELILSILYIKYFKKELKEGNPFTHELSKGLFKLGIYSIVISIITITLAAISYKIIQYCFKNVIELDMNSSISLNLGIFMIILSFICEYGSELRKKDTK